MVNCVACSGPVSAGSMSLGSDLYHPKCFVCVVDGRPLTLKSAHQLKGKLYCQQHIDERPELLKLQRKMNGGDVDGRAKGKLSRENSKSNNSKKEEKENGGGGKSGGSKCIIM